MTSFQWSALNLGLDCQRRCKRSDIHVLCKTHFGYKRTIAANFFGRWIVHGDDDSVVYIRSTHKLVELVKQTQPDVTIRLDVALGQDHAFDHLNENWETLIKSGGFGFVQDAWLGPTVSAAR